MMVFLLSGTNFSSPNINTLFLVSGSSSSSEISYWGYQLQNVDLQEFKESNFEIIVTDYSQDGSNDTTWSTDELNMVKEAGKILVSYISIGEAEDYRYYWQSSWLSGSKPTWLGDENPEWQGNYKVKYWEKGWQDIVYNYLDIIISQGFNGVYLDIIDAYEYYLDQGISNARNLMIDFVHNIFNFTRTKSGSDFLIIPQNGEGLLNDSNYRSFISGIGIEDLFYQNDGSKNSQSDIEQREQFLDLLVNDDKFVLTVDYVKDTSKQADVYSSSRSKRYIPYTTDVALDTLTPPLLASGNSSNSSSSSINGFEYFVIIPSFIVLVNIHFWRKRK